MVYMRYLSIRHISAKRPWIAISYRQRPHRRRESFNENYSVCTNIDKYSINSYTEKRLYV